MEKQFSVLYNGHPVAVTELPNDEFVVQVSYKCSHLKLTRDGDGNECWVDMETNRQTSMSKQMGQLISDHLLTYQQS